MTGQVKEDVLARLGELGVTVRDGRLGFAPALLPRAEFLAAPQVATVRGVDGPVDLPLAPGTLAFTVCQVPVVYRRTDAAPRVSVVGRDGTERSFDGAFLDAATSRAVFERTGAVARIEVAVPEAALRGAPS
jgi:hypothetical protein